MSPEAGLSAGPKRLKKPLLWTALFAGLSLFRILFHEMWRDEMNIWVAVVDSSSLTDLIHSLRYGGHGVLWPASVYAVAWFVRDPLAMQCLHVAIATAAVWILFRFSPFPRLETLLFGFGYYLCFEYAVISRHYAWGVLCLMAVLASLTARRPNYAAATLGLAMLMQTTVYGIILAAALAAAWAVARLRAQALGEIRPGERVALGVAAVVLTASAAAAVIHLRPPADGGIASGWLWAVNAKQAGRALSTVWEAFVPVPYPGLHFWNTNVIKSFQFRAALGVVAAMLAFRQFRSSPAALTCWTVGFFGLLLFAYVKYMGYQRHHGQMFLAFMAASWLMAWEQNRGSGAKSPGKEPAVRGPGVLVYSVLVAQLLAGVYASAMDLAYPFSASQAVAAYIRGNRLDNRLIVADLDYLAVPVVGRLDHTRVYYPRAGRTQRLVIWDKQRLQPFTQQDFLNAAKNMARQSDAPLLVLLSYPLTSVPPFLKPLAHFEPGIVKDESYDLYLLSRQATEE